MVVMTVYAMAKARITEEAFTVADTIVLAAEVPLAVAAFSYSLVQASLLLFSCCSS